MEMASGVVKSMLRIEAERLYCSSTEMICTSVAVEKSFPHNCGVWHIDGHDLDFLAEGNRALLAELATCREDEYWPTNYENVRELKVW